MPMVALGEKWLLYLTITDSNKFELSRCSRSRLICSTNKLNFEINDRLSSLKFRDLKRIKRCNKKIRLMNTKKQMGNYYKLSFYEENYQIPNNIAVKS